MTVNLADKPLAQSAGLCSKLKQRGIGQFGGTTSGEPAWQRIYGHSGSRSGKASGWIICRAPSSATAFCGVISTRTGSAG
uniref:Uncharacterized protein n=1 Tax=mine drainage metagenome TaxID=410659 RepID=E6QD13_9ZZZZ